MTKQTVSLVLSSGGARGLAHIGVIEWLLENKFEIHSIAGSSIGALIGGIYAAGQLETYKKWACALEKSDVFKLLDLSFGWSGLFKGERIIETLKELIGDRNIQDLPISFTAVATDVELEKEVWITQGPLFDAIRASIATPVVFTPHEIDGRRLLDGGLINPVPIAPTLKDNTDLTVAVYLGARPERLVPSKATSTKNEAKINASAYHERILAYIDDVQGKFTNHRSRDWDFLEVLTRSLDTMQNLVARSKLAAHSPDVIINIPRNSAKSFDYHRARELIELGRSHAASELSHLAHSIK